MGTFAVIGKKGFYQSEIEYEKCYLMGLDIIGIKSHHVLDYYQPKTTTILVTAYKDTEEIEEICDE